jgi:NAD(P)-dependent dehydrogenase (short-subunit alcohol dehydrogenase family)
MPGTLLVTGASRGIGASIARRAAADGYDVALTYAADRDAAQRVAADVEAAGRRALVIHADVAREADVVAAFAAVDGEFGRLDAVAINAGITGSFTRVEDIDASMLERVLAVNVVGAFTCAREAVRRMSTARGGNGGAIVVVSSVAARIGSPNEYVHYAASKAAVDTMVLGLAKEVAREGIRVNAVAPGLIDTEIHARGGRPERVAQITPMVPMGRIGTPDEVTEAVMWLLSAAASYVTGAVLDVSGGR